MPDATWLPQHPRLGHTIPSQEHIRQALPHHAADLLREALSEIPPTFQPLRRAIRDAIEPGWDNGPDWVSALERQEVGHE